MLSGGILTKSRSSPPCLGSWKSPRSPSETARRRRAGPLPVGLPMFFLNTNRGASQRAGRPARHPGPSGGGGGEEGGNDGSAVALPNPRLGAHTSGSGAVFRATACGSRAASGQQRERGQTHTRARHANHSGETRRRQLSGGGHSTKRPRRDALARRHKQRGSATQCPTRQPAERHCRGRGSHPLHHGFSPSPTLPCSASAALEGQKAGDSWRLRAQASWRGGNAVPIIMVKARTCAIAMVADREEEEDGEK
ncbi:hypothetical protein HPB50_021311 [Hyalomma asiaticum]|uniref:Uncharacterized protein n=1 Tax=Hyalomma asiaticum TaxID=266040 RepID=A0ACB7S8E9_HYAAI|nr:hypothetical protein HPB50_021311 [Hyalomma asiaticum]